MKKKHVFLASIAFAVVLLHSCRLPSSVEIRADNVAVGFPLIAEMDITEIFRNAIPDDLNVRVYDVENGDGVLAFMIAYEIDMLPSFNIGEHLDGIDFQGYDALDPIEASITVPSIEWDAVEPEMHYFDMRELFYNMENSINRNSMPRTTIALPFPFGLMPGEETIPLPPQMFNMPPFFAATEGGETNFDAVIVSDRDMGNNVITLNLGLNNPSSVPEGLAVTLEGIRMVGANSGQPIGFSGRTSATLSFPNNFADSISIDISGTRIELADPPRFEFDGISVNYFGLPVPGPLSFDLVIHPRVDDIALRGAEGLRIGTMSHPIPEDIIRNIEVVPTPGFLNAGIGDGRFSVTADPPSRNQLPCGTYGEGLLIVNEFFIRQAPMVLGGEIFEGLGADGQPWVFGSGAGDYLSLDGKTINGSTIEIAEESSLTVNSHPDFGISFELFGEHFHNKTLPVYVAMSTEINVLETVRWELDEDLIPIPEVTVDFTDIDNDGTDITEFIYSITFSEIGVNLDFTKIDPALEGRIALSVNIPGLDFGEPRILTPGPNEIHGRGTLDLRDSPSMNVGIAIVPVIDGVPVVGGRYLAMGPFNLGGEGETVMDLAADVSVDFEWEEAVVDLTYILGEYMGDNLAHLSGGLPEDPIDLRSTLGEFMYGFTFARESIDMALYLGGSVGLLEMLSPTLSLHAIARERNPANPEDDDTDNWVETSNIALFDYHTITADELAGFPDLDAFSGPGLPAGGIPLRIGEVLGVIAETPEYLRFAYNIELPATLTITPGIFEGDDEGEVGIRAMVVARIAMEFETREGAYFRFNMFDGEDLFNRSNTDEPMFGDNLNLNFLRLRADFDNSIFHGSVLHVDGNGVLFPEGLPLGTGNRLELVIRGADLDVINNNLIPPDIRIEYPRATRVKFPRNPLPTRISISVSGNYTINLFD